MNATIACFDLLICLVQIIAELAENPPVIVVKFE